jgi:hypothetical protein
MLLLLLQKPDVMFSAASWLVEAAARTSRMAGG